MTDRTVYVQGKKVGATNVSVFDQSMRLVTVLDLEVTVDTVELQSKIRSSTGSKTIRVSNNNGQVVLSGVAGDAVAADRAVSLAKSLAPTGVVNAMTVAPSQQVLLQVRFLEASRDAGRALGVNWRAINGGAGAVVGSGAVSAATGNPLPSLAAAGSLIGQNVGSPAGVVLAKLVNGGTSVDMLITALETKGLVRRLAEPNLVALSGDTARFLAGGSYPYPTISSTSGGAVTPSIEFKDFGVSLTFNPTVLRDGVINLRIAPEVSELDFSNAVTISGTTVPSLIRRNADTTIELRDGQSFAIAGLLQADSANTVSQLPWIGSVPVLGALFRSSDYQKHQTDLVIIVTPHLAQPAAPGDRLATPFDQRLQGNDVDFFLMGQMDVPKQYRDYVTSGGDVYGPYGHIIAVEPGSNEPAFKNKK
jgi:pilus assembly protein CpaC